MFKRVSKKGKLGIQDLGEGGLVWFDEITPRVNHKEAFDSCKSEQWLPSEPQFETAESHGFEEAFAYDMNGIDLWSSTLTSRADSSDLAILFRGKKGNNYSFYQGFRVSNNAARCAGDPGLTN